MTDAIARFLSDDHHHCDQLLAACETALSGRGSAAESAKALIDAMERHFRMEEEVLFPELEEANPMARGPTGVMRIEHQQMRQLFADLSDAVAASDREGGLGVLETLHILAQQHNAKEEGILYPLADAALPEEPMIERLRAV
jgi:hemerythrin-like domain-containing protein